MTLDEHMEILGYLRDQTAKHDTEIEAMKQLLIGNGFMNEQEFRIRFLELWEKRQAELEAEARARGLLVDERPPER